MRLITDIHKNESLSLQETMDKYSDGRGISWLLEKRINSLIKLKFVIQRDDMLIINSKFVIILIRASEIFKKLIKIGKGGI